MSLRMFNHICDRARMKLAVATKLDTSVTVNVPAPVLVSAEERIKELEHEVLLLKRELAGGKV